MLKITGVSIFSHMENDDSLFRARLEQMLDLVSHFFKQNIPENQLRAKIDQFVQNNNIPGLLFQSH